MKCSPRPDTVRSASFDAVTLCALETNMNCKHLKFSKTLQTPLLSLPLLTFLAVGCAHDAGLPGNETLVFDFRSSDVAGAFAEDIDPTLLDTREGAPHYEAQLRLLLSDGGVKRFQRFNKAHHGQTFE